MQKIITIARADGILSDKEGEALYGLAETFNINSKVY